MTDQTTHPPDVPPTPERPVGDLSERIAREVAREPRDHVTCVRVFDDFYRCNWWAPDPAHVAGTLPHWMSAVSTHRVRKSRFLSVVVRGGQLEVTEVAGVVARQG